MSLDIALPPAIAASGGPPGAGPPTPADLGQVFAALLAQQGSPPPSRPTAKSLTTADETREERPRKTKSEKNADQDSDLAPASAELSLASQTTQPPNAIVPAAILIPSGPPVSPAAQTTAANIDSTSEAMDTRPASTPASQGGTDLISGGELLPQSAQPQSPTAGYAPASALPNALPQPALLAQASASIGSVAVRSTAQSMVPTGKAVSAAVPKDVSAAVPKDVSAAVPKDVSAAVPKDVSAAVPKDVSAAVPKDVSAAVPKDVSAAVPKDVSAAVLEDMSQTPLRTTVVAPTVTPQKSDPKALPSHAPAPNEATVANSTARLTGSTVITAAPSPASSAADPAAEAALTAVVPVAVPEKTSSQIMPAQTKPNQTKPTDPEAMQTVPVIQAAQASEIKVAPVPTASISVGTASAGTSAPADPSLPIKPETDPPVSLLSASIPDPASQSTKTALQGYAQFTQITLQNPARPANNTGMRGDAPATQGKGELAESVSTKGSDQTQRLLNPVLIHAAETLRESARQGESQDDTEKDKSEVSGSKAFSEMLTPTNSPVMETKTATVSATAPLTSEGRAALTEQAAEGMQAMHAQAAKNGHGQMTLQLHPQDWGKLQVSVTMAPSPSGTVVTAHLVADSAAVKHALESSGADLKRTLRDAGLHLDNFTVTVRPAAAGSEAQTTGGNGKQNASPNPFGASTPGNRGEGAASTAAGNGGTAFGGNSANTQSQTGRQRPMAASLITDTTNEPEEQTTRVVSSMARRLDTRA